MRCLGVVTVPAQLDALRGLRQQLGELFVVNDVPFSQQQDALLAVSEAVSNVVRHGVPSASFIAAALWREGDNLEIRIEDDGGPFSAYADRNGRAPPLDQLAAECGMGVGLIASLFPIQCYEEKNSAQGRRVNRFTLRFKLPGGANRRARLLVVDDDETVRELISRYLLEDFEVCVYADGLQALQSLRQAPVDLVISDIHMPQLNGLDLRRCLTQTTLGELTPFVFLTGEEGMDHLDQACGLGVDDYLVKPVGKTQLLATVKRVLKRAAQLRHGHGLRLDQAITAALRPRLPPFLGPLRAALRTRNASAGGGDFVYHCARHGEHYLVLGDIMGHGEQAKFFAHAHVGFFVGLMQGVRATEGPSAWLRELSQAVVQSALLEATLVTCVALQITAEGELVLAAAGHPPPLRIVGERIEERDVGGAMPGLDGSESYAEQRVALAQGRLCLYTDGLFDSADAPAARDSLRHAVLACLSATGDLPLEQAADRVIGVFDAHAGPSPADDATFILLERVR
jgi:serine/threonine-protein kinase RsbW